MKLLTVLAFLLVSLVWPESGWGLAVMILSAWLVAVGVIDLDNQWLLDVLIQGVLWTGLIAAQVQQSPLTLQDVVTGVLVRFIISYSLCWITGIILRKEALGMGGVLPFAALGDRVGSLLLPNVALIASCRGLTYVVITKRGSTTPPFGLCLSLGGIATLYLQALF